MLPEKNTILGFNQYIKSDKVPHIIYADIESLINKRDINDMQIIQKILQQQKQMSIFLADIQCQ